MIINGIQKLTLLDYPGHVAATVFFAGCNFRCPFCHNAGLVTGAPEAVMTEDEFFAFLIRRRGILDGVTITGGEPTLSPELFGFCERIKGEGFAVKLDTNGTRREVIERLVSAGLLDYIAMDIKNSPEKYPLTAGFEDSGKLDVDEIFRTADYIMEAGRLGKLEYEFRTTAVREFHTEGDFARIGELISGADAYYIQRFEDSGALIRGGLHGFSDEEMRGLAAAAQPYVKNTRLRGV